MYDCSSLLASYMWMYGTGIKFYFSYGRGGGGGGGSNLDERFILRPSNFVTFTFSVPWTHFGYKIDPPEGLLQLFL